MILRAGGLSARDFSDSLDLLRCGRPFNAPIGGGDDAWKPDGDVLSGRPELLEFSNDIEGW